MGVIFGSHQTITSQRMSSRPRLAKLISRIFGYTNVGNFARSLVFRKLMKRMPLEELVEVLDLGCGFGEYAVMMSKAFPHAQVTGLELHKRKTELLDKIKAEEGLSNLSSHLGLIETLPEGKQFDLIYSVDVFEHILEPDMPFSQAFERLNSGGRLLVKMPSKEQHIIAPESWFVDYKAWLDEEHIGQVYELEDLTERFKKEGFEIEYAAYSDGWLSRLGWELSYFGKRMGPAIQLAVLPWSKLFVRIDNLKSRRNRGNAIQVIGRKPMHE